jgi:hypothetical protein
MLTRYMSYTDDLYPGETAHMYIYRMMTVHLPSGHLHNCVPVPIPLHSVTKSIVSGIRE